MSNQVNRESAFMNRVYREVAARTKAVGRGDPFTGHRSTLVIDAEGVRAYEVPTISSGES